MRKWMALAAMLALSGCSLTLKPVELSRAKQELVVPAAGKPIVIETITDAREFSKLPDSSTPRIDPDYLRQLGEAGRNRVIAGSPHGPVMLVAAHDRTVMDETRDLLADALKQRGYRVVDAADAPAGTPRMSVQVKEFWCYIPFNFGRALTWTQQMKAWVAADITITNQEGSRTISVKGYGAHIVQTGTERNIAQAYDLAMTDFDKDLGSKLFTSM
jgi:hypothetical protein